MCTASVMTICLCVPSGVILRTPFDLGFSAVGRGDAGLYENGGVRDEGGS